MKKVFILFLLFVIASLFAIYLVYRENEKKPEGSVIRESKTADEKENKINMEFFTNTNKAITPTVAVTEKSDIFLTVLSPVNNQTTGNSSILVRGKTLPLISVMVNEHELVSDSNGDFSKSLILDEGENYINIIAYDRDGALTEKELLIIREVAQD